jgi:CheY-like chemotaxis protein
LSWAYFWVQIAANYATVAFCVNADFDLFDALPSSKKISCRTPNVQYKKHLMPTEVGFLQTQSSLSLGMPLRILIADDHEIVRAGIRSILLLRSGVQVFESCNGQEAIEQARKTNPDVIILDVTMPVMTGIEAARRLKKEMPQVPILILSMHDGESMANELAQIGVQGYVSKTDAAQKLPDAIDAVVAGGTFFGAVTP